MAGLMMVFLLIAVIYAKNAIEIVTEWQDSELAIYSALKKEFEDDMPKWNAEIEKETLTIRFNAPEILFLAGSADLTLPFQKILRDFMPRYIKLLHDNFKDEIKEVRIEGHTSSEWVGTVSKTVAFIENMNLSQKRTRSVLYFSMNIQNLKPLNPWIRKTVSANGLSSAQLVIENDIENKPRSRRVEFTIRTKTKEVLFKVLDRAAPAIEKRI